MDRLIVLLILLCPFIALCLPTYFDDTDKNLQFHCRLATSIICQNTPYELDQRDFYFEDKTYTVSFVDEVSDPTGLFKAYLTACAEHSFDPKLPVLNCQRLLNLNLLKITEFKTIFTLTMGEYDRFFQITPKPSKPTYTGVSIIIPIYNRPAEALACLSHLLSVIKRPTSQWEIILVDDGSTDGSGYFLQEMIKQQHVENIRIVWTTKVPGTYRNVGWTRNAGAKCAKFPILAFCDCDQYHLTDPVTPTLQAFQENPNIFVSGNRFYCSFENNVLKTHDEQHNPPGWVAVRKELFMNMGGYDERFDCWVAEDIDMRKRLMVYGLFEEKSPRIHFTTAVERDAKHRETPENKLHLEKIVTDDFTVTRNVGKEWGQYRLTPISTQRTVQFRREHL